MADQAPEYRIYFKDPPGTLESPSPDEVYPSLDAAQKGITFWETKHPEWKGQLEIR